MEAPKLPGVVIYSDGKHVVYIEEDHYHGIAVQLLRWVKQRASADAEPFDKLHPINTNLVHASESAKLGAAKLDPKFKTRVSEAVAEAKLLAARLSASDTLIEGTMNDYKSQANVKLLMPGEKA